MLGICHLFETGHVHKHIEPFRKYVDDSIMHIRSSKINELFQSINNFHITKFTIDYEKDNTIMSFGLIIICSDRKFFFRHYTRESTHGDKILNFHANIFYPKWKIYIKEMATVNSNPYRLANEQINTYVSTIPIMVQRVKI